MISVLPGHDVKFRVQMMLIDSDRSTVTVASKVVLGIYIFQLSNVVWASKTTRESSLHMVLWTIWQIAFPFCGHQKKLMFLCLMDSCCEIPFPTALASVHEAAFSTESIPSCLLPMHWFGRHTHTPSNSIPFH